MRIHEPFAQTQFNVYELLLSWSLSSDSSLAINRIASKNQFEEPAQPRLDTESLMSPLAKWRHCFPNFRVKFPVVVTEHM